MSEAFCSSSTAAAPALPLRTRRATAPLLAALALVLVSGCTQHRDSITVGAVPDDYRTNHPIVIGEKEQVLDLPVGTGDRGITQSQRVALEGFLSGYDRSAAPVLKILAPTGSANGLAAAEASAGLARVAKAGGVPRNRILVATYQAGSPDVAAPIRISFTTVKAHVNKCGRWPADLGETSENKHYANFGCSYQNNLAAQVANPTDLLGPRKPGEINAENRTRAIEVYQQRGISDEFLDNSEVEY